jgi:cytochrome c peroxidase
MSTVKPRMQFLSMLFFIGFVPAAWAVLTPQQQLGKLIYFDTHLSEPVGQACASCHDPRAGFADPDRSLPVSEGVIPGRFGGRNAPSAAYASFFPTFSYSPATGAIGGQFWDGRAPTLADQAKGPFLNPVEMNNPDKASVIDKIRGSTYATLFEQVYGIGALNDVDTAYIQMADAIAAYETTSELNQFTSKFDAVRAGRVRFTMQEARGQMLFNGRANCSVCHVAGGMMAGGGMGGMGGMGGGGMGAGGPILFTDFRYHNLGLPKNTEYPLTSNPVDFGLGAILGVAAENGKFKTEHLRNIALTGPYMHNGLLKSLKDVVHFYNTRDIPGLWPAPEVPQNVERTLVGNLGLTNAQEDDIVAFLLTLTDGYTPPPAP